MRKRVECRTRDLHQSLLVKLARAMARAHSDGAASAEGRALVLQPATLHGLAEEVRRSQCTWRGPCGGPRGGV